MVGGEAQSVLLQVILISKKNLRRKSPLWGERAVNANNAQGIKDAVSNCNLPDESSHLLIFKGKICGISEHLVLERIVPKPRLERTFACFFFHIYPYKT